MGRMSVILMVVVMGVSCGSDSALREVTAPGPVTLQDVQSAVFTPSCATLGCHVGGGAPRGLDLSEGNAFGNLVNVPSDQVGQYDRVNPGNAADSYVYMKVTADGRILGDPMPAEGDELSSQRKALLREWIEQGANP